MKTGVRMLFFVFLQTVDSTCILWGGTCTVEGKSYRNVSWKQLYIFSMYSGVRGSTVWMYHSLTWPPPPTPSMKKILATPVPCLIRYIYICMCVCACERYMCMCMHTPGYTGALFNTVYTLSVKRNLSHILKSKA